MWLAGVTKVKAATGKIVGASVIRVEAAAVLPLRWLGSGLFAPLGRKYMTRLCKICGCRSNERESRPLAERRLASLECASLEHAALRNARTAVAEGSSAAASAGPAK